ncbi:hypothetical protein ACVCL0_09205 [Rhodanobacter sp. UC4450_H17]
MRITFEDHGQDFLTWQLDNNGVVVDCLPFQATFWCGATVLHPKRLKVGSKVAFTRDADATTVFTVHYRVAAIEPDLTADAFTAQYPVGTPCRYYPVAGDSEHLKTKTRSEAWTLGHGAVVVKIEGRTGGVDINHLVMEG